MAINLVKTPKIESYTETRVPAWAMCYIFNGDSDTQDDTDAVDEWLKGHADNGFFPASCSSDEYFSWRPQFGLACNCVDLVFVKH